MSSLSLYAITVRVHLLFGARFHVAVVGPFLLARLFLFVVVADQGASIYSEACVDVISTMRIKRRFNYENETYVLS